jgi:hypothetical protein
MLFGVSGIAHARTSGIAGRRSGDCRRLFAVVVRSMGQSTCGCAKLLRPVLANDE